ncbi:hypothetical protein F5X68DRAFT_207945 [Plectosphaerella plurivora]|uniref:Cytochrome c oxidase assembly protein COX20, mitochondrial n=1 Tax=Plectosphaerella plurivora TaxID=936078 RepID=A0A9P8VCM6_9PEZI|nr:hypothetical protein F5X68DRAFT_207945 [Plectosphaerella plurivora]
MAGGPEGPEAPPGGRRVWLWTKAAPPTETSSDPAATSQDTPPTASKDSAPIDPRLDTTRTPPKDLPVLPGKLDPSAFQTNFPQQQGAEPATVSAALKTIKPEDFLAITSGACARDGFLGGITTGALVGGTRFVMRAPVPKAANWAFGGFLAGCVMSFEYCQWKRRQERVNMRRAVEVYQDNLAEKHRQDYEERVLQQEQAAQAAAESAKKGGSWYKFW